MSTLFGVAIWASSIIVAYKMAEKRNMDTTYAIVGGLLFGWFAPFYYLFKDVQPIKK